MVLRYDKAYIQDFSETSDGYLTIHACPVTRPGVFPYLRQDGKVVMEAKLPEELFSETTIASAQAKPMTDDHPNELVTAANYPIYAKGMTHTDAAVRDNKLVISFTITDSATIEKIRGGKRELSIGFVADIAPETGTYNGETYESVQRNMEINHIAIVDKGRAGPSVAIRADSAVMVDESEKQGGRKMPTVRIDNKEYEVDPVVKSRMDALEAQTALAEAKVKDVDKLSGERDALQAKLDKSEADLGEEKKKVLSVDELDKLVANRIELTSKAKEFLGDSFDFSAKTDRAIKEEVIASVNKTFKGDDKSDDYINAFFDAMTVPAKGFTQGAVFNDAKSKKETSEEVEKLKNNRLNLNKKEDK